MIFIYYTSFDHRLPLQTFNGYLSLLPFELQIKNKQYLRWQDQHLHLFGKLLLIEALKKLGCSADELLRLNYNKYQRPFINKHNIDFNISHSDQYAVCVIAENCRVGIDIERKSLIDFRNFKNLFTSYEWEKLMETADPNSFFFHYWCKKESIAKADGRGLNIPLNQIDVTNDCVVVDNNTWHVKNIGIDDNYISYLATDHKYPQIKIQKLML